MGELVTCANCGTLNDKDVNPDHCYSCGHVWGDVTVPALGPDDSEVL